MKRYLKAYVEKSEDNGILRVAVATDSSIDRDDERIDPTGWDFTNFLKNPVLLWAHDYRSAPIGKIIEIVHDGGRVLFSAQFAVDISHRARETFELFKQGFLNAFSVGFIPKEWKDEDDNGKRVRTFTRTELLEISAVPVPANPNAVVLARGMKSIGEDTLKQIEEAAEKGYKEPADTEESKSVVPHMNHGTMPMDASWSGPEQMRMAGEEFEKLRKMCTWFDSAKPEVKASYKLPHHMAESMRANFRGVAAAMAALMGARGGVQIPESDRKGVYNHLAKHYEEFGKEPPEFKLVEMQVLKNIDIEFDMPAVIQIVKVDDAELMTLKEDIKQMKSAAALSGTGGLGGGAPGKNVDPVDALLASLDTGQILKVIDKAVGEGLRRLKGATDPRRGKR